MKRWGWVLGSVVGVLVACGSDPSTPQGDAGSAVGAEAGASSGGGTSGSSSGSSGATPGDGLGDGGSDNATFDAGGCGGSQASQQIVQATADWAVLVDLEVTKVINGCKQMASDLGVAPTDIDAAMATPDPKDRVKAICGRVVSAIASDRQAHPEVHVDCHLQECSPAADVNAACSAKCGTGQDRCDTACSVLADAKGGCPFATVETSGSSKTATLATTYFPAFGAAEKRLVEMAEGAGRLSPVVASATDVSVECITRTVHNVTTFGALAAEAASDASSVIDAATN